MEAIYSNKIENKQHHRMLPSPHQPQEHLQEAMTVTEEIKAPDEATRTMDMKPMLRKKLVGMSGVGCFL
jgi:hypothetical protein